MQLPEVDKTDIHDVLDVSPVYIFYDETQPDSTLLNRKNVISTTNWLVNVDKRLTLRQVVPHLQYLQEKRQKASMHKNDAAKNYFTCNDKSINSLGFLEFTGVKYNLEGSKEVDLNTDINHIMFFNKDDINIITSDHVIIEANITNFLEELKKIGAKKNNVRTFFLGFKKSLSFQDYVTIKSMIKNFSTVHLIIDKVEFIF